MASDPETPAVQPKQSARKWMKVSLCLFAVLCVWLLYRWIQGPSPVINESSPPRLGLNTGSGYVIALAASKDSPEIWISSGNQLFGGSSRSWDLTKREWSDRNLPLFSSMSPDGRMIAQVYYPPAEPVHRTIRQRLGRRLDEMITVDPTHDYKRPELRLIDVNTGELLFALTGHTYYIKSVAFSPNSRLIASGGMDGTVKLWSTETGESIHTATIWCRYFDDIAFSPDGKTLAVAASYGFRGEEHDDYLLLLDVDTGEEIRRIRPYQYGMNAVAFSRNGRWVATTTRERAVDRFESDKPVIHIWDLGTGWRARTLQAEEMVMDLSISEDGSMLAAAEYQGFVEIWDIRTWKKSWSWRISRQHINTVTFTPDGKALIAGTYRDLRHQNQMAEAIILNSEDGTVVERIVVPDQRPAVESLSISEDGQQIIGVYSDGATRTWSSVTGRMLSQLASDSNVIPLSDSSLSRQPQDEDTTITCAAAFRDGRTIASGGSDGTIKLWNAEDQSLIATFVILPPKRESEPATEWVTYTPESYYVCSKGAEKSIYWIWGDAPYPKKPAAKYFNRADKVKQSLAER